MSHYITWWLHFVTLTPHFNSWTYRFVARSTYSFADCQKHVRATKMWSWADETVSSCSDTASRTTSAATEGLTAGGISRWPAIYMSTCALRTCLVQSQNANLVRRSISFSKYTLRFECPLRNINCQNTSRSSMICSSSWWRFVPRHLKQTAIP